MLDIIKAMQDPDFINSLQQMPQQILDKLNSIDRKLDALLRLHGMSDDYITALQQNSISANLQNDLTENPEPANINPVDPDSYK